MKRLVFGMILSAGTLLAQPPRGTFNWWESPLTQDINLSEDQRTKIRDAIREYRPKLIDLRANLEKAEIDTEEVLNDENVDQKRAGESIERLVVARGDMTRAMSQMSMRLRRILTAEQWKELQGKRRTMMRPGQGMGPGQGPMDPRRRMDRRQKMDPIRPGAAAPGQMPPPEE